MKAKNSRSSSYAWKSILHRRNVIERGSRRQIGNVKPMKVWQHSWLPIKHPPMVQLVIVDSMEEATVDILIDESTRHWNHGLIDGLFAPQEVEIIKKFLYSVWLAKVFSTGAFL